LKSIDSNLWARLMLEESSRPPKFYPNDFKDSAEIILNHLFGINVDGITHDNCKNIYLRMIHIIDTLPVCSDFFIDDDTTY